MCPHPNGPRSCPPRRTAGGAARRPCSGNGDAPGDSEPGGLGRGRVNPSEAPRPQGAALVAERLKAFWARTSRRGAPAHRPRPQVWVPVGPYWAAHSARRPCRPRPQRPCGWHFEWQRRSPEESEVPGDSELRPSPLPRPPDHPASHPEVTPDAASGHQQLLPAWAPGPRALPQSQCLCTVGQLQPQLCHICSGGPGAAEAPGRPPQPGGSGQPRPPARPGAPSHLCSGSPSSPGPSVGTPNLGAVSWTHLQRPRGTRASAHRWGLPHAGRGTAGLRWPPLSRGVCQQPHTSLAGAGDQETRQEAKRGGVAWRPAQASPRSVPRVWSERGPGPPGAAPARSRSQLYPEVLMSRQPQKSCSKWQEKGVPGAGGAPW